MRRLPLAGLLLFSMAQATDADDLLSALKRARTLEARGQVQVTVNFPPRPDPVRLLGKLPALPFRPALLAKNFEVVRGAADTVAGRPALRFELTPKIGQAPRWTLWIDSAWNIPLAFEERRADGALARQAVFVKVGESPVKVAVTLPAAPVGLHAALKGALLGLKLPAGFTPVSLKRAGQRLEITLSDGANTLLLVLAPRNVQPADGVASRRVGGRFVWLVGNLPSNVLADALTGIKIIDETALGTFLPTADSK